MVAAVIAYNVAKVAIAIGVAYYGKYSLIEYLFQEILGDSL